MNTAGGYRFIRFGKEVDEIWLGDQRVFVLPRADQSPLVLNGICPHRGGPLALGEFDCRSKTLRCPWHGQQYGMARLNSFALPALRAGNSWMVVLEARESDAVEIRFSRNRGIRRNP
jgi:nitrite reductase/ring-hydroxylating ferredoxin subunit